MEILTETIGQKAYLEGASNWTVAATWKKGGVSQGNLSVSYNTTSQLWEATLPYFIDETNVEVLWDLTIPTQGQLAKTDYYDVVTPILPAREISKIIETSDAAEIREIEAAVRHIINAHTGQTFGRFTGSKVAVGNGDNSLALPARLISFEEIIVEEGGLALYGTFDVAGGGWYINPRLASDGYSIRAEHSDYVVGVNGVIYNPYGRRAGVFPKDTRYTIDGVWGYQSVPLAVSEAAKLLINDYAVPDSAYRDRYLESLTSPDWRIQFHSGAFQRTGNVRADQLLSDYVLKRGWAVI